LSEIEEETLLDILTKLVKDSCIRIAPDAMELLKEGYTKESNSGAKKLLATMIENVEAAIAEDKPVCQSPGFPVAYVTLGGNMKVNADLPTVFSKAIVAATKEGYLRPSIVDPITRKNTGDNSGPGIPDIDIAYNPQADYMDVVISFKGCGAELPTRLKVLTPAQVGQEGIGIKRFILDAVVNADGIPCPPSAVGVGIGGQIHVAAKLSRKAIGARKWSDVNPDPRLAALEKELLEHVNSLGIGPGGVGGDTTALAVKIEIANTHTAICPVAVNFHCWVARRGGVRIYPDGSTKNIL